MPASYDESDLPPEEVTVLDKTWQREKFDRDGYQWTRVMDDDEYSWDSDEVSLVGTDTPIQLVQLQYLNGVWQVTASETAGPEYHRPGFTELIGEKYSYETSKLNDAVEKANQFMNNLSG